MILRLKKRGQKTGTSFLLFVARNKLEGSIPTEFGKLSRLQMLNLSKSSVTGSLDEVLGRRESTQYFCSLLELLKCTLV